MARPLGIRDLPSALAGIAIGAAVGVGAFTFFYAHGASYLSNDARACANCHVMREEFSGWVRSTHHAVATCNDCHMPHDLIGKATTKARNGFWHSLYFTTGGFRDPIQIKPHNRVIVEANCRGCHEAVVAMMTGGATHGAAADELSCVRCHGSVGHP
jgi:cytochrome c nitrite reductase small subunit